MAEWEIRRRNWMAHLGADIVSEARRLHDDKVGGKRSRRIRAAVAVLGRRIHVVHDRVNNLERRLRQVEQERGLE